MALNKNKIAERFAEEQRKAKERENRQDFQKFEFWKAPTGTSNLRVMPPWTAEGVNADQFWRELYVHWNVGESPEHQRNISCPKLTPGDHEDKSCLVCDYVAALRDSKNPADTQTAKDFRAKQQFYMNVVDLDDPVYTKDDVKAWQKENQNDKDKKCPMAIGQTKVQIWGFGPRLFRDILSIFNAAVSSGLDISDLDDGRDIIVNRTGKSKNDTVYTITAAFKSTSFDFNLGEKEYVEDALNNLDGLFPFTQEERILEVLPSAGPAPKAISSKSEDAPATTKKLSAKAAPAEEEEDDEPAPKKAKSRRAPAKEVAKETDDAEDLAAELADLMADDE